MYLIFTACLFNIPCRNDNHTADRGTNSYISHGRLCFIAYRQEVMITDL